MNSTSAKISKALGVIETLYEMQEYYGFWGFVWRGVVLGLPIAIALPILHPQLFEPKKKPTEVGLNKE